ncbi:MAG: DUF4157 domain-containing protein [Kofleriaceae bacterium]|nr:DUF4157 domain-containing protein [Kofleriaceae bacterium]MCL4225791.1 DUF4157 domain-containing protein [Myxococcales bacterium]
MPLDALYEQIAHRFAYQDSMETRDWEWLTYYGYQMLGVQHGRLDCQWAVFQPTVGGKTLGRKPVVAFRGTSSLTDVQQDVGSGGDAVGQFQFDLNAGAIATSLASCAVKPVVTGHSLGGALAQLAACRLPSLVGSVVTFQAPAIDAASVAKLDAHNSRAPERDRIRSQHHVVVGDPVSDAGQRRTSGTVHEYDLKTTLVPLWRTISKHLSFPIAATLEHGQGRIVRPGESHPKLGPRAPSYSTSSRQGSYANPRQERKWTEGPRRSVSFDHGVRVEHHRLEAQEIRQGLALLERGERLHKRGIGALTFSYRTTYPRLLQIVAAQTQRTRLDHTDARAAVCRVPTQRRMAEGPDQAGADTEDPFGLHLLGLPSAAAPDLAPAEDDPDPLPALEPADGAPALDGVDTSDPASAAGEDAPEATATGEPSAAAVQHRSVDGEVAPSPHQIHAAAAAGIRGGGQALPHLGAIQASFGAHDVSGIRAHVGGAARDAARAMGAQAYATGDDVAFARFPDLHTAAHEAAHVVQQRGGVQLAGGIGQAGDSYERHADEVADRVVRGESAEDLLDRTTPTASADRAPALQQKPDETCVLPTQGTYNPWRANLIRQVGERLLSAETQFCLACRDVHKDIDQQAAGSKDFWGLIIDTALAFVAPGLGQLIRRAASALPVGAPVIAYRAAMASVDHADKLVAAAAAHGKAALVGQVERFIQESGSTKTHVDALEQHFRGYREAVSGQLACLDDAQLVVLLHNWSASHTTRASYVPKLRAQVEIFRKLQDAVAVGPGHAAPAGNRATRIAELDGRLALVRLDTVAQSYAFEAWIPAALESAARERARWTGLSKLSARQVSGAPPAAPTGEAALRAWLTGS